MFMTTKQFNGTLKGSIDGAIRERPLRVKLL
jgi:hypothetical protein